MQVTEMLDSPGSTTAWTGILAGEVIVVATIRGIPRGLGAVEHPPAPPIPRQLQAQAPCGLDTQTRHLLDGSVMPYVGCLQVW